MDRAVLADLLAQGRSLEEIGRLVGRHASTVGYWVEKHGLEAVHREKHRPRGGLAREQLATQVARGLSTAQLAEHFAISQATVRHWLKRYGMETRRAERYREARAVGKLAGDIVLLNCPHHGRTEFKRRPDKGYRCLRCRSEAVSRRRRRVKAILVEDAGGRCRACGYDRCVEALEFHHLDPAQKRFALSYAGITRSLARARQEAAKCVLLCSNCHAEVEAGKLTIS